MTLSLTATYIYHALALLTALTWGMTFISTKVLLEYGLLPEEVFLYRFVLAYVATWFVAPKRLWADNWRDELLMAVLGVTGGSLYFLFENTALNITLASNVSLLICTTPIMTAFVIHFSAAGERLNTRLLTGSAIALAGVGLVVFNGSFILQISPLGDTLTLLASLTWAFYSLILQRLDTRYPVLFITRKVFLYGILTLLPYFCFRPLHIRWAVLTQPVVFINLLFLGLVASMLCYIMWNTAVKKLGAVRTSNYIYVMPLVTLIASAIILHEHITLFAIGGSILITAGVYMVERKATSRHKTADA